MKSLKELYKDYFKIGVACEKTSERFTNNEIGNPDKEKLMAEQFSSMTFGNELKPDRNMGFSSPEAKDDYLPFVINPSAKAMLDWARDNGMPVRGHVMVWHSQCPREVFCKNYQLLTIPTDPEQLKEKPFLKYFEKLDPAGYTDRETMLSRMKTYINSLMEYMFANNYDETIYAWDVVNEAIELNDKQPTGLRDSYWYQVIGDDFVYWAFKYAMDAAVRVSQKYSRPRPKLFYNDYNSFQSDKQEAILGILNAKTDTHGSIISEGLIDGIGMQGHLSDNNDVDEFITALKKYDAVVDEVQITELDVKCTCTNVNAEYYQAVFYKKLFEALIDARKSGANITSVTFWGLTDDNSWIRGANPLLYRGDLSTKKSYDAVVYAITGESLGEPEQVIMDLSDRVFDFEPAEDGKPVSAEEYGFKMRGFGEIEIQDRVVHSGKYALANEKRFGDWCGIGVDLSDFVGQTIEVSAYVKSPAPIVTFFFEKSAKPEEVLEVDTSSGDWTLISGTIKVPGHVNSILMGVGTKNEKDKDTFSAVYLDDMKVHLIGQFESFEEETNIASIRGVGHLPVCFVTDKESHTPGGHSYCVTRHEKDATMKFDVSTYIGKKVSTTLFVKTTDKLIRVGVDGTDPEVCAQVEAGDDWTEIAFDTEISKELKSAQFFVETDGNADFYVDDIVVKLCE